MYRYPVGVYTCPDASFPTIPLCGIFGFLERIPDFIILPQPYLLLLLRRYVLDPDLFRLLLHELPNISRIP